MVVDDGLHLTDVSLIPTVGGIPIHVIGIVLFICILAIFPGIIWLWLLPVAIIFDLILVGTLGVTMFATAPHLSAWEYLYSLVAESAPETVRTAEVADDPTDYEARLDAIEEAVEDATEGEVDPTIVTVPRDVRAAVRAREWEIRRERERLEREFPPTAGEILTRGLARGAVVGVGLSILVWPLAYYFGGVGSTLSLSVGLIALSATFGGILAAESLDDHPITDDPIHNE